MWYRTYYFFWFGFVCLFVFFFIIILRCTFFAFLSLSLPHSLVLLPRTLSFTFAGWATLKSICWCIYSFTKHTMCTKSSIVALAACTWSNVNLLHTSIHIQPKNCIRHANTTHNTFLLHLLLRWNHHHHHRCCFVRWRCCASSIKRWCCTFSPLSQNAPPSTTIHAFAMFFFSSSVSVFINSNNIRVGSECTILRFGLSQIIFHSIYWNVCSGVLAHRIRLPYKCINNTLQPNGSLYFCFLLLFFL